MDKNSTPRFLETLHTLKENGTIDEKYTQIFTNFFESYLNTVQPENEGELDAFFLVFLERVLEQIESPYLFEPYHKMIRSPFDYHKFGLDFLRPLVVKEESKVYGKEHLDEIAQKLAKGENAVFLANHQTEADPMAISLLIEEDFPELAGNMIFVAGERVTTDPLAIPFSMGCNLLCIYSKRYIDTPPEQKHQKQLHNKKTMQLMSQLLSEGGKCIYVAPSGGRDRKGADGEIEIAPFDPNSIEMFYVMAKRAKTPTSFYPMALGTFDLLPPPETVQVELGEVRSTKRCGIHLSIGEKIDMEHFPGSDLKEKLLRRKSRSDYIWEKVVQDFTHFPRG